MTGIAKLTTHELEAALRADVQLARNEFENADDQHRPLAQIRFENALRIFSDFVANDKPSTAFQE